MQFFWLNVLIFLLGLAVGSFLNCVIFRLAEPTSFLKGRSKCPKCKQGLRWHDLIPILSYLILGGKCRYCKRKISWQYPAVEISTGLIFLLIFNFYFSRLIGGQAIFNAVFLMIVSCFLIVIFVYDLKYYIIPDKIIYPAIVITFLYRLYEIIFNGSALLTTILSGLGAATFFLLIVVMSRGKWMGVGDIKLAFLMGLLLGWPNILVALFFAFMAGALAGLAMIVAKKKTMKSEVPFGPFLAASVFVALFFGNAIINWYWSLLLI